MAPPLYPKIAVTPSSARTCMIIRAPDIVWPAKGCPKGRGWMTVSLMGRLISRGMAKERTSEPSSLGGSDETREPRRRSLESFILVLDTSFRSDCGLHASYHCHTF